MLNKHAQALGRLNKGKTKTMSEAAIQQRKNASKRSKQVRKAKNMASQATDSQPVTNNRILTENKA